MFCFGANHSIASIHFEAIPIPVLIVRRRRRQAICRRPIQSRVTTISPPVTLPEVIPHLRWLVSWGIIQDIWDISQDPACEHKSGLPDWGTSQSLWSKLASRDIYLGLPSAWRVSCYSISGVRYHCKLSDAFVWSDEARHHAIDHNLDTVVTYLWS